MDKGTDATVDVITISSDSERSGDESDTDYEPEPKRSKLDSMSVSTFPASQDVKKEDEKETDELILLNSQKKIALSTDLDDSDKICSFADFEGSAIIPIKAKDIPPVSLDFSNPLDYEKEAENELHTYLNNEAASTSIDLFNSITAHVNLTVDNDSINPTSESVFENSSEAIELTDFNLDSANREELIIDDIKQGDNQVQREVEASSVTPSETRASVIASITSNPVPELTSCVPEAQISRPEQDRTGPLLRSLAESRSTIERILSSIISHANDSDVVEGSSSSISWISEDMNPNEIPSDEEISPPYPPPAFRNRRNAIFQRRDPPPPDPSRNQDDDFFQNELEVASVSDINENPIEDASSTSGGEEVAINSSYPVVDTTTCVVANFSQSELTGTDNNFADIDAAKSQLDSEEEKQTQTNSGMSDLETNVDQSKWRCSQCHSKVLPYFRYCLRCFKIRRNWLPKRPHSRRLKKRKRAENSDSSLNASLNTISSPGASDCNENILSSGVPTTGSASAEVSELGFFSQQSTQDPLPAVDLNKSFMECETCPDSQSLSQPQSGTSSSSQSQTFSTQTSCSSTQSSSSTNPESYPSSGDTQSLNSTSQSSICSICCVREKNSAFVHNKTAHIVSCYTCADRILKRSGKCPICREHVFRVVKLISA